VTHKAVVVLDEQSVPNEVLALRPGKNLMTGEKNFRDEFEAPTTLELDLLTLASAIYASDLAFKREERSNYPRKKIELTIPVVNWRAFQNQEVARDLRYALYKVSHDVWDIEFVRRDGAPEPSRQWPQQGSGKVLLFSGGLDSMAAAVLYGKAGERTYLSSHVTANQTISDAQRAAFEYLDAQFSNQFSYLPFRVVARNWARQGYPFPTDRDREPSQRTRSFLFLALAALVARRKGLRDIVVIAENGQMAIHLPLTAGRISAFSTHTAHPEFVQTMGNVLSVILDYPISIHNPFLYKTKAETVENTVSRHREVVKQTVSCWKASRVPGELKHCGFCVPCLSRRIALEANGLTLSEYDRDILAQDVSRLPREDEGRRNLVELAEFAKVWGASHTDAFLMDKYPNLENRCFDSSEAIGMYRRFAQEALDVFARYPSLSAIIGET
jgi:7-cyano-7-deazaguanine synthase in queuosine biosynthesis